MIDSDRYDSHPTVLLIFKSPTGTATSFIGKPIEFNGKTVFTPRFLVDFPIIPMFVVEV